MQITLRPDEKIYINGAVLRVDRKVSVELLNDAAFLLEAHVMGVDAAVTPLRQLYFVVQMMLIGPNDTKAAMTLFTESLPRMLAIYDDKAVVEGLQKCVKLVETTRYFDALKVLRSLFAKDDAILSKEALPAQTALQPKEPLRVKEAPRANQPSLALAS